MTCRAKVLHRESELRGLDRSVAVAVAGLGEVIAALGRRFHVTDLSRNGAGFRLILCEMLWKHRGFFAANLTDRQ
jgi:hypothetical protein